MNKKLAAAVLVAGISLSLAAPPAAMAATQQAKTQGNVNLRAKPDSAGKILRTLTKGENVFVLNRVDNHWLKVQDKSGIVGYVSASSSYISISAAAAEKPAEASKAEPAVAKPSATASKAEPAVAKPSATASKAEPAVAKPSATASKAEPAVAKPSATASKAEPAVAKPSATASKAEPAVAKPSATASKAEPAVAKPSAAATSKFAPNAAAAATVALRVGPSTANELVRYLKKGEELQVKSVPSSYWYQVIDSNGKTGYVSSDTKYITVTGTLPGGKNTATTTANGSGTGSSTAGTSSSTGSVGNSSSTEGAGSSSTAASSGNAAGNSSNAGTAGTAGNTAAGTSSSTAAGTNSSNAGTAGTAGNAQAVSDGSKTFTPNAVTVSAVSFRQGPSTAFSINRTLKVGEQLQVTATPNAYWYAIKDASGNTGYVSSDSKYIALTGELPPGSLTKPADPLPALPNPQPVVPQQPSLPSGGTSNSTGSEQIEAVITAGLKYLGTPYEYGSNRNDPSTFDCSDFVRQAFMDALGNQLPVDSRIQGQLVLDKGMYTTDWNSLKRGDLMFFVSSGTKVNAAGGLDSSIISHVGIYLGDNKILQTYSKESGGVQVTSVSPSSNWQFRFLFGGSAL